MNNYILVDGQPVAEPDILKWARSFGQTNRRVDWTEIKPGVHVSTVFLGTDHQFRPGGKPLLYESMVFGGVLDQSECDRYSTREEALAGHAAMCQRVRIAEEIGAQPEPEE